MKGRSRTKDEIKFHDAICEIGCIVCIESFKQYTPGTVHHIDGRTKPGAHTNVICLCARHHQVPSPDGEWATRHGPGRRTGKAEFEKAYGTEQSLLEKTMELIGENHEM